MARRTCRICGRVVPPRAQGAWTVPAVHHVLAPPRRRAPAGTMGAVSRMAPHTNSPLQLCVSTSAHTRSQPDLCGGYLPYAQLAAPGGVAPLEAPAQEQAGASRRRRWFHDGGSPLPHLWACLLSPAAAGGALPDVCLVLAPAWRRAPVWSTSAGATATPLHALWAADPASEARPVPRLLPLLAPARP